MSNMPAFYTQSASVQTCDSQLQRLSNMQLKISEQGEFVTSQNKVSLYISEQGDFKYAVGCRGRLAVPSIRIQFLFS